MNISQSVVEYLRQHELRLTTAESCTAGKYFHQRAVADEHDQVNQ